MQEAFSIIASAEEADEDELADGLELNEEWATFGCDDEEDEEQ